MIERNVRDTHHKYLREPEVASEYLKEALVSGDKTVIENALRNIADAYSVKIVQFSVGREFGGPDSEYD
jgi:DNA-binding phage protein